MEKMEKTDRRETELRGNCKLSNWN